MKGSRAIALASLSRQVVFMVEGNQEYQEIGCYADTSSDRVLTYRSTDSYLMTPDVRCGRWRHDDVRT